MLRIAIFDDSPLAKRLVRALGRGAEVRLHPPRIPHRKAVSGIDVAVVGLTHRNSSEILRAIRSRTTSLPVGSLANESSATALPRSVKLGFDLHVDLCAPPRLIRAQLSTAHKIRRARVRSPELRETAKRLSILTDIVKTANKILEPRQVIEMVMAKIQTLIPSEAWSMLMVNEEKRCLSFEMALGEKGPHLAPLRVRIGEGVAGWVAQTGKPAIVNDVSRDHRFSLRFDSETHFHTRSILCAPLISRGRTIGVVQVINRLGDRFTRADLGMLLTLVEPCAIAIENAMLFQRSEQLTITDDLTKLFNSRYLNIFIEREIKRSKRHGNPLSLIFLDLDGFKNINDQYGHLAGSKTLTEVGAILTRSVRETDVLARYGGDEFVVVLPETPAGGAAAIAERIRHAIAGHRFLEREGLHARLSASLGIACYPDHAVSPGGLILKADQAMYRVKEKDKNGIAMAV
ncbi:MAG: sensor domain-containing diguanylate cyclase [Vicinamibacteria bacterium]|nr:sensor domain-containing diguanylate cyclase [Vicinamibacteria bacterium]